MDLAAVDLSYDPIWNNLTQNYIKLIKSNTSLFAVFFSPLTNSSKVKAKIFKVVKKITGNMPFTAKILAYSFRK